MIFVEQEGKGDSCRRRIQEPRRSARPDRPEQWEELMSYMHLPAEFCALFEEAARER
jgi:hypothetical protein